MRQAVFRERQKSHGLCRLLMYLRMMRDHSGVYRCMRCGSNKNVAMPEVTIKCEEQGGRRELGRLPLKSVE